MPRKSVPISSEFPYHISARCHNREWFRIPIDQVWKLMEDYLFFISHAYKVEILAFVLMNNHFHLLLRDPQGNLAEAMNYLMRETSRRIGEMAGRINQTYGSRFHRTLINDLVYFDHVYKYVYRNPVEAGLCVRPQDWPYSTLHALTGQSRLNFPLAYDSTLFFSYESTLHWLNQAASTEETKVIINGLKKAEFKAAAESRKDFRKREAGTF